jgi:hypothetical protein
MDIYGGLSGWGISGRGRGTGKERILRSEEDQSMLQIYCTYKESIIKPTKHCLKKEEERRENGTVMEEVNLFKAHCKHVWNYHNEIPSYY